jgi:hypothetical protein
MFVSTQLLPFEVDQLTVLLWPDVTLVGDALMEYDERVGVGWAVGYTVMLALPDPEFQVPPLTHAMVYVVAPFIGPAVALPAVL